MKNSFFIALCSLFLMGIMPSVHAITRANDSLSDTKTNNETVIKNIKNEQKQVFLIKKKLNKTVGQTSKAVKIMAFAFVGLLLASLLLAYQSRWILIVLGLVVGLLALIIGFINWATAKSDEDKKSARRALWTVLGVILGVILISVIAFLKIGFA